MESRRVFFVAHLVFVEIFSDPSLFQGNVFSKIQFERFCTPVLPTDDDCWLHGFLGL